MTTLEKLIREYLSETKMLQIATSRDNQPWCCTVYFSYDENLNIYWISKPERRHSEEILENPKVSGVIVKPHSPGDKVRGISLEGKATLIERDSKEFEIQIKNYSDRYDRGDEFVKEMMSGENPHELYKIEPSNIILFDELNFPDNPRQVLKLNQS